MTDDLKDIKAALRKGAQINPREDARRAAIARAMEAYDRKFSPGRQGSGLAGRLTETAIAAYETLIGRRPMKLTPALMGGASLAVLTLVATSALYVQMAPNQPLAPNPATIERDVSRNRAQPGPEEEAPRAEAEVASDGIVAPQAAKVRQSQAKPAQPPAASPSARNTSSPTPASPALAYGDRIGPPTYQDQGRDRFQSVDTNPVKVVAEDPVSTFSIDVDTASYAFMRASLNNNVLPPKDAVRVEELINYFAYEYERPDDRSAPFKANVSVLPAPWSEERKLIHIGIAGFELTPEEKPRSNLVFLLDTSGSMNAANKLPLLRNSMKLLLETLEPEDTVAIVTYAGSAGTVLEPTPVKEGAKILSALDSLRPGGSTAGAEGIRQAYQLARQNFDQAGINRVILATDGDFNVGITNPEELKGFVERQRQSGVFLSVLGFGMGNYNDALMQALAQNGNGNAAYIDTLSEARKVLVEEAGSTLFPIAQDVKIQVEFNPEAVAEYRLIGYETRLLRREDFNNDKVDAGEIGAGHRVTAIYEITPRDSGSRLVGDLRYRRAQDEPLSNALNGEYAFLKIRYKLPGNETSELISTPISRDGESASVDVAPQEARFAASVAAFGQLLRGGRYLGSYGYDDVIALARGAEGPDEFGYRAEFINLVRLAKSAAALRPLERGLPRSPRNPD